MAPEILARRAYGYPVDVYAYGILLNEMVTVQRPYDGSMPEQVVQAVLASDTRPSSTDKSPILSKLIHLCWNKDPQARPKFEEVEVYLKKGMQAAASAQHVCNALAQTVTKLVSCLHSQYVFEREDSLQKLRDMLDPAQDLYQVKDVQEALRLAGGMRYAAELLDVEAMTRRIPSGASGPEAFRDSQVFAAEVLANACDGNHASQEEAGSLDVPRALVQMLRKVSTGVGGSAAACHAATRSLLLVCGSHEQNCVQAGSSGASVLLLALAARCAPTGESFERKPLNASSTLGEGPSTPSFVPGLQMEGGEESFDEEANTYSRCALATERSAAERRGMASAEDTSKREVCSDVCTEGAGGTSSVQAEMTTLLTAGMPAPAAPATNRPEGPEEILFADADAVLNATHSVSDVSSADAQRTSNAYDPFAPTPQELKRQEEGLDEEAFVQQMAKGMPELNAGFPTLVLQTLRDLSVFSPDLLLEVARQGMSVLIRFLLLSAPGVQALAEELLTHTARHHLDLCARGAAALPLELLMMVIRGHPILVPLSETAIYLQAAKRRGLQQFWASGCLTYLHDLLASEDKALGVDEEREMASSSGSGAADMAAGKDERSLRALETLTKALEIKCNQEPFVETHTTALLIDRLKKGPSNLHRVLACRGLRSLNAWLSQR